MQSLDDAFRMLDAFVSVGAKQFDVTFIDIDGHKRGFRPQQSLAQLRNSLPQLFPGLIRRSNNLVIRPIAEQVSLIQLDDLDHGAIEGLKDVAFITIETSPANHQSWLAVSGTSDKDLARRLRNGTGADPTASGAVRLAGCVNYKRKYEPDFPTVSIIDTSPGRIVNADHLESRGLVAPKQLWAEKVRNHEARAGQRWPDYERCLAGAPLKHDGSGSDVSRADYLFARIAAQWGRGVEEIAAKLMNVSEKAQENGEAYASRTAANAAAACERGR